MKRKLLSAVVLLSFSLTFMSCEEILDLADIPIETTLSTDVQATSASATESSLKSAGEIVYSFEGSATIDPTDDAEVDKYWNKIRSWEIKRIHNSIRTITKNATLIKGELVVTDEETKTVLYTEEVENVNLSTGAEIMNIVGADYKQIITALEAKHSLVVTFRGDLDQAGVAMVFALDFDVKIMANALN